SAARRARLPTTRRGSPSRGPRPRARDGGGPGRGSPGPHIRRPRGSPASAWFAYYAKNRITCKRMTSEAAIVLEDGTVFRGSLVGAPGVAAGEACFTTASTGYEEAATDPSYGAQVLCCAYPLVGNYGVDPARMESGRVQAEAIVMRTARPEWAAWLREQNVVAIADVDTRALVRRIRVDGVLRCAVGDAPIDELHARALAQPPIDG